MLTAVVFDPTQNRVDFAFDGSIAVNLYDLLYHDTNDVKPASSQADAGSEAANQAAFAPLFAGLAGMARLSTDGAVTSFPAITDAIVDIDCASATFEVGDKITVVEQGSGTALENAKVTKTTDETLAIGYVVKRYASATTRVRARLISRVAPHAAAHDISAQLASATLPILVFNGATGANEVRVPDNLADALSVKIVSGADFLVIDSTDSNEKLSILSATSQKLGFYGATPVTRPAALTAANGGALNTGDATSDTVIGNIRTRVGEIETKLQALGLLA